MNTQKLGLPRVPTAEIALTSVGLSPEEKEGLKERAEQLGLSRNACLRCIVRHALGMEVPARLITPSRAA